MIPINRWLTYEYAYLCLRLVQQSCSLWSRLSCADDDVATFELTQGALRWRETSASCDAPLTDLQAFRYNMVGAFFNQTLPSSIADDAMRLWR
ncbi:hypothetical protein V1286_003840 [Bradyrhizobium algeriense]|uniref:Uncharacterized protein n=1 Tax=Bradyrhizobium algeriense TaxID=634784 RepID=A0ABU8BDY7_9BRAD